MKYGSAIILIGAVLLTCRVYADEYLFETDYRSISVEDDQRVYNPIDLSWDESGICYLLCKGSCTVLVLNQKMELLSAFGECGEGPGELGQVKAIEVVGGEVFVFQDHRLDIFSTSGEYISRKILAINITDTAFLDDRLVVSSHDGDRLLSTFDLTGEAIGEIGPLCEGRTWDEKFSQCSGYRISGNNLVNFVSGAVFHQSNEEWTESDWGLPHGKVWNEGGAVYAKGYISACCELKPGMDTLVVHGDPGEEEASYLSVVAQGQKIKIIGDLDSDSGIRNMKVSPNGDLWVLYWDSEVRLFSEDHLKTILRNR